MSDSTRETNETPNTRPSTSEVGQTAESARDEEFLYLVGDGSDLMRAGRIDEALHAFNRALVLSPTNEQALNLKGLCLFRLGNGAEAARVFEALVAQNPDEPSIRLNLAMVYMKLGAFEPARHELGYVLAANPGHPRAKNLMGMVREKLGHPPEVDSVASSMHEATDSGVPPPPTDFGPVDDDVPEPPTLSELDFAAAMGGEGATQDFDVSGFSSEPVGGDDSDFASPMASTGTPLDDETIDVPAPAEDDFSDLNAGIVDESDLAGAEPLAASAELHVDETTPRPFEETLPAYDVAAFNAHIARKEAEKAAREAELARTVQVATTAAAPQPVLLDDGTKGTELESRTRDAPPQRPEKLSVGAEAAALVAASTAALRREKTPALGAEKPRGSFGFSVDDSKADATAAAPTLGRNGGEPSRVTDLAERAVPNADGRLENGLLSIRFSDVLYLRTDVMVALAGELEVEPVNRRYRGRRTDSFFGGPKTPLSAAIGHGTALVDVDGKVVTVIRLDGEDVYLLESAILAFSDGVVWENGRLPGENGDDLDIVHLRGDGRVYLQSARPVVGLPLRGDLPATIRASALVGWQGQVVPFRGPFPGLPETVERPAIIRFEGTGTVLVG